jgi:hypothetical protein
MPGAIFFILSEVEGRRMALQRKPSGIEEAPQLP